MAQSTAAAPGVIQFKQVKRGELILRDWLHPRAVRLVCLLVACGGLAHAATPPDFPPSFAPGPLAAWVKSSTDLPFAAIGSVSTSGVIAVLPTQAEPQDQVTARLWVETLDPTLAQTEAAMSWSAEVFADCRGRRLRFGAATGFARRNRQGSVVRTIAADALWRNPSSGEPSDAIWRAACGRPVVTAFSRLSQATSDHASPIPRPDPPPPAAAGHPSSALPSAAPAATKAPRLGFVVQLAALPGPAPTELAIAQMRTKLGDLIGPYPVQVARAQVGGRLVQRLLVTGLANEQSAKRLCADLRSAGQVCLVRRMVLDPNDSPHVSTSQ